MNFKYPAAKSRKTAALNNFLNYLIFQKFKKMTDISVSRLFSVVAAYGLLLVKVSDIQIFQIVRQYQLRAVSCKTDADACLHALSVALNVVCLHNNIGCKSCSLAGVYKNPVHTVIFADRNKRLIAELVQGQFLPAKGIFGRGAQTDARGK